MPRFPLLLIVTALAAILALTGCPGRPTLRVMAADALSHSFRRIRDDFARAHPDVDVILECQGSLMLARLAPLRPCDVLVLADARLVRSMLAPDTADWVARIASTEMALVWTDASPRASEVRDPGWVDVLLQPDVRLGLADPAHDPCGYFSLLALKLCDTRYGAGRPEGSLYEALRARCPADRVSMDAVQLLSNLQAHEVDYAIAYRCHAQDMRLPHLALPPEVNLGDPARTAEYEKVEVTVPAYRGGTAKRLGSLVTFGLTIPRNAPHRPLAEEFARFCLAPEARKHLEHSGLRPLVPPPVEAWGPAPAFLGKP